MSATYERGKFWSVYHFRRNVGEQGGRKKMGDARFGRGRRGRLIGGVRGRALHKRTCSRSQIGAELDG